MGYDIKRVVPVLEVLSRRLTKNPDLGVDPSSLEEVLNATLDAVKELLDVEYATIWLKQNDKLVVAASNEPSEAYKNLEINVGEGITGLAVEKRSIQKSEDVQSDERALFKQMFKDYERKSRAMMSAALLVGFDAIGAFSVYKTEPYEFTKDDEDLLKTITNYSTQAILLARRNEESKGHVVDLLYSLMRAFMNKTSWTFSHSGRVVHNVMRITDKLDWKQREKTKAMQGAITHDLGKFGIPNRILDKPEDLTDEEFNEIREHPNRGVEIIKDVKCLQHLIPSIRDHHERLNGTGYPNGITDIEDIPLVIAIADSYDAMTERRPYKPAMPVPIAMYDLLKNSGQDYSKGRDVLCLYRSLEKIRRSKEVSREIKDKLFWRSAEDVKRCQDIPEIATLLEMDKYIVNDDGPKNWYKPKFVDAFRDTLVTRKLVS